MSRRPPPVVVDGRSPGRRGALPDRLRLTSRVRGHVEKAVRRALEERSIVDIDRDGQRVRVPMDAVREYEVRHDPRKGVRHIVLTGNDRFVVGDRIPKSGGAGGGSGAGAGAGTGKAEDDFVFELDRNEFLDVFFDDLELPDLETKDVAETIERRLTYEGIVDTGPPSLLDVARTYEASLARRAALGRPSRRKIRELEEELERALAEGDEDRAGRIREKLEKAKKRYAAISAFEDIDMRFRLFRYRPEPVARAVMFCLMDVSGSMGAKEKDIAKRFFVLLYLFLQQRYRRVDIVFIRHTEEAQEVDEETFFHSRETGGTRVSSCIRLMMDIQRERYPASSWNVYAAQVSDGDNFGDDNPVLAEAIEEAMGVVRWFGYIEVHSVSWGALAGGAKVWDVYRPVAERHPKLAMRRVRERGDVVPVFRDLFRKREKTT